TNFILNYFNRSIETEICGHCSNCVQRQEKTDMTEEAQMILSCVKRMGERFGVGMTAKVLRGSKDKKIYEFNLNKLSTYGLLSAYTERELTEWIHFLIAEQFLNTEEGKYPILKLNHKSVDVLKGKKQVWMYAPKVPTQANEDYHKDLFEELRKLRKQEADEREVPPYVLFSDATLKELSRYFPETKEEMLQIKGIGEKKYEQFGESFLEVILNWRKDNPEAKKKIQISGQTGAPKPKKQKTADDRPSHLISYQLFQSGKSVKDIAVMRELSPQTIENHIFKAFEQGHPVAWNIFFNEEEEAEVLKAHNQIDEPRLKPLREALPEEYDYTKIKAVLVKNGIM